MCTALVAMDVDAAAQILLLFFEYDNIKIKTGLTAGMDLLVA